LINTCSTFSKPLDFCPNFPAASKFTTWSFLVSGLRRKGIHDYLKYREGFLLKSVSDF